MGLTTDESLRALGLPDVHADGGTCRQCAYCLLDSSDEVPKDEYGVCVGYDDPRVVSLDERHDWDECWTGAA